MSYDNVVNSFTNCRKRLFFSCFAFFLKKMNAYDQFRFVRPNFKVSIVYMIKEGICVPMYCIKTEFQIQVGFLLQKIGF